jgi:hypothetical protein
VTIASALLHDATIDSHISCLRSQGRILDEQWSARGEDVYAFLDIEVNLQGEVVELLQVCLIDKCRWMVLWSSRQTTFLPHQSEDLLAVNWWTPPLTLNPGNTRVSSGCCCTVKLTSAPHIRVDCLFIDASFGPSWDMDDPMHPDAAESRSGCQIKFDDGPVAFATSRRQGEAALSTVVAKYMALSRNMPELLWLRRIAAEVASGLPDGLQSQIRVSLHGVGE